MLKQGLENDQHQLKSVASRTRYDDIEKMIVSGPAGPLQGPLGDLKNLLTRWSRQAPSLVTDHMFN